MTQSGSTAGDNSDVSNTGKQCPRLMTQPASQSVSLSGGYLTVKDPAASLGLFLGPLSRFVLSELSCLFSQCTDYSSELVIILGRTFH